MKIGIDFRPAFFGRAGIGRCTRELCRAMAPLLEHGEQLVLFGTAFHRPIPGLLNLGSFEIFSHVRIVRGRFPNRVLQVLGRLGLMGVERFTGPLDLFVYTDFVYPPLKRTPNLVMLYDLLFMDEEAGFHDRAFCRKMRRRVGGALARARGVVVPSRATQEDLDRYFPDLGAAVRVIPLGGDHLPDPGDGLSVPIPKADSFFLSVGTFEPRKNHLGLLEAFVQAAPELPDTALVIAGAPGWLDAPFRERLARSGVKKKVHLMEAVDDHTLSRLYRDALALVYPSLGEGFGLPVAEAMAAGCPVITSNRPPLTEVAGQAAYLVDPNDRSELASALVRLARDTSIGRALSKAGRERAKEFTWPKTADRLLAFARELVLARPQDRNRE